MHVPCTNLYGVVNWRQLFFTLFRALLPHLLDTNIQTCSVCPDRYHYWGPVLIPRFSGALRGTLCPFQALYSLQKERKWAWISELSTAATAHRKLSHLPASYPKWNGAIYMDISWNVLSPGSLDYSCKPSLLLCDFLFSSACKAIPELEDKGQRLQLCDQ